MSRPPAHTSRAFTVIVATVFVTAVLLSLMPATVRADPAEILVKRGESLTALNCSLVSSDWDNFPMYVESTTGSELKFRHDGENLYMLVRVPFSSPSPMDYWGIEFDNNGDGAHMGTSSSPDDAIFTSTGCPSFTAEDAYLIGFAQPIYDEDRGGTNDVTGLMQYEDGAYTIQITRPFITNDDRGKDVDLGLGVSVGVGFVFGTFGQGAAHKGTDMTSYVLAISNETSQGGGTIILVQQNYLGLAASLGQLMFFFTLGLCVFHFFRRRAWRVRPYESKELEAAPLVMAEVPRHEASMRFAHWAHVVLMGGLLVTGYSIHEKTYILGSGTTYLHLALAFTIAFIDLPVHFLAMWRSGDMRNIFTPKKDDIKVAVGTTTNFFYLSKKYPEHATWDAKKKDWYLDRKYCSYQKYLFYGDLISIIVIGITGLALYWPETFAWLNSLLGGSSNIRALHLFIFYYFAATVLAHAYLSFIPSNLGRMKSMITGKGKVRVHTEPVESKVVVTGPTATGTDGGTEEPPK